MDSSVLIVGSMAFDDVRTPAGEVKGALGGTADYSSVAASFFAPVKLVGVVGDDFPAEFLRYLNQRGVDTAGVQIVPGGKTFYWSGYFDTDTNVAHTLDTQLGVFADFQPILPAGYVDTPYVLLANIGPDLQLQVLNQARAPRLTLCDSMNLWINTAPDAVWEVLRRVDIGVLNDGEAKLLTKKATTIQAGLDILERGPRRAVIVKKGEHGALLFDKDGSFFSAPSYPLPQIADPTGAGDSFAGGLIGYIAQQGDASPETLRRAVIYGSVMASYNVEDFSLNRLRSLTMDDIQKRYAEFERIARI